MWQLTKSPVKKSAAPGVGDKSKSKLRVGFVLVPRFTLTAFAGFIDTLRLAADDGDRSRQLACEWSVLGSPVTASCGTVIEPWDELKNPKRFDYLVVVGGTIARRAESSLPSPVLPPRGGARQRQTCGAVYGILRPGEGRPA